MIPRHAAIRLNENLEWSPAVALLGPRQAGKTTLAKTIAANRPGSIYLDLERAADRARLADASAYLEPLAGRLVVIDEVHRTPGLFEGSCQPKLSASVRRRAPGSWHGQIDQSVPLV